MTTMLKLYLLAVLAGVAFAKNSYVVVAPTTFRPGMDFEISVNILNATADVNVKATLKKGTQSVTSESGVLQQVLPKFEVTVELPPYVLIADNDITATVKAKYTYGKPVKGTAKVVVTMKTFYHPWLYDGVEPKIHKTLNIDGEGKVAISLADMKQVFPGSIVDHEIVVSANVTEGLTGITLNGSSSVHIYEYATKLSFSPTDPETFKPGLKYIAYLQVQQQDGRPVQHSTETVNVTTQVTAEIPVMKGISTPAYVYPQTTSYTLPKEIFTVPDTGVVPIEIDIPVDASTISFSINYGEVSKSKSIDKSYSPSDNYIQLLLKSQHLYTGSNVNFDVKSTEAVDKLVYQVMSRGSIVATGTISGNNQDTFNFTIQISSN